MFPCRCNFSPTKSENEKFTSDCSVYPCLHLISTRLSFSRILISERTEIDDDDQFGTLFEGSFHTGTVLTVPKYLYTKFFLPDVVVSSGYYRRNSYKSYYIKTVTGNSLSPSPTEEELGRVAHRRNRKTVSHRRTANRRTVHRTSKHTAYSEYLKSLLPSSCVRVVLS